MKTTGAMRVNLDESPLGTRSRLANELFGKTILRRTVERTLRSKQLDRLHVVAPAAQVGRVRELLAGLSFELETHNTGPAIHEQLVRAGRMWGLDSWRGGIGSYCVFDEDFHGPILHALARKTECDMVATIPAAAPLFDVQMLDEMIRHARGTDEPAGFTFVQAPPGIGAFLIRRHIVDQMAAAAFPPGAVMAYKPSSPMADMTGMDTCYRPSAAIIQSRGRLLCDTDRSMQRVSRLIEAGAENWESEKIAAWLSDFAASATAQLPSEIEIELTTEVPNGLHSLLRTLGGNVPRRGPISLAGIQAVADCIRGHDDVRLVLGGHGEPCLHPQFAEICRLFRQAGAAAIAVRTTGLVGTEEVDAALFETPVDVVEIMLDAATAKTYARVNGVDAFDRTMLILKKRLARRSGESRVRPLWVPSLVKANETFDDLESFVDHWQRQLGMHVLTGYSHCAGQRTPRAINSLAPPSRVPCRRVRDRAMILADGSMTTCDQDFRGLQTIGRIPDQSLTALWRESSLLNAIRETTVADAPLCAGCDEWHRP